MQKFASKMAVPPHSHPVLISVLRKTVEGVEEALKLNPDDPAMVELKTSLLRALAELEIKQAA
jgi:hypothetical protein